ncbi:Enkurin [Fasciola gigantica]|uniref:Enkurin n=1 Tax=Fasciola gigantica TaxID=46835 RepID=A0A504YHW0_FASGI|nr:Enkurin [Fasciola gigantica]
MNTCTMVRETIYNLLPKEKEKPIPLIRYSSRFKKTVVEESSENKKACKSMGPANVIKPKPSDFLKKNANRGAERRYHSVDPSDLEFNRGGKCPVHKCLSAGRKPCLPGTRDLPIISPSNKDFVELNKRGITSSVPKKPKRIIIDTRYGHTMDLAFSGLEPLYLKKTDFGQLPEYLTQRHKNIEEALKQYNKYVHEIQEKNALNQVTPEERMKLINGMKQCWQKLYKQYQTLSVMIDTPPKMSRKSRLENQMNILEHDIEFLDRFETILVEK